MASIELSFYAVTFVWTGPKKPWQFPRIESPTILSDIKQLTFGTELQWCMIGLNTVAVITVLEYIDVAVCVGECIDNYV